MAEVRSESNGEAEHKREVAAVQQAMIIDPSLARHFISPRFLFISAITLT